MKLTKYFMPLAALGLLASCSNDAVDAPNVNEIGDGLYLSLQIQQSTGTRSGNSQIGSEVGQTYENSIGSALIVFVNSENNQVVASGPFTTTAGPDNNNVYKSTGKVDRETMENFATTNSDTYLDIYAICNPGTISIAKGADINQVLLNAEKTGAIKVTLDNLWGEYSVLMTGKGTQKKFSAAELKGHTTAETALDLGNINVYRAVSRFDVKKANNGSGNTFYLNADGSSKDASASNYAVSIELDAFALCNMSPALYLFKNLADYTSDEAYDASTLKIDFGSEGETATTKWVADPKQVTSSKFADEAFVYPVFNGTKRLAVTNGNYEFSKFGDLKDNKGITPDKNPTDASSEDYSGYGIWRYSTPNTILKVKDQTAGNSTGVIFRAKLGVNSTNEAAAPSVDGVTGTKKVSESMTAGETVYALNNVIYGNAANVKAYADASKNYSVYVAYQEAYKAAKEEKGTGEPTDAEVTAKYVSAGKFTAYEATNVSGTNVYYCYYYYWNRHNDNANNSEMGRMEFGAVRNNIYKLAVTAVNKLGRPDDPDDDPDPLIPDTPDETEDLYMSVSCQVMKWTVRQNNIEF